MRVLLLTLYFEPDVAANAVIMTELAEELTALGHELTVVTAFPHYAGNVLDSRYRGKLIQTDDYDGIRVIRTYLYTSPRKDRFLVRFLNYVSFNVLSTLAGVFSGPQDIILAPSPPLTIGLSAFIIGTLKRIPYVYNVQDIYPDVVVKLGVLRNPRVIAFSRWLEKFVYRHGRHMTVLSDGFRANLLGKGVPLEKITVIPNFVDADFIRPLPRSNDFSHRHNLDGKFVVLYAGNIGHSQPLHGVMECAKALEHHGDIAFLVVGDGSKKPSVLARAQDMGLDNVLFIPFQAREDVPLIYATAGVSLVPLKRGIAMDSVPSKAYTIMASGRPLLAGVDQGSYTWELVKDAECGLCVEPEDSRQLSEAILHLYNNPALCRVYGQRGREYVVDHYSTGAVAQQYDRLLRKLIYQD